jgi:hypothetical protein
MLMQGVIRGSPELQRRVRELSQGLFISYAKAEEVLAELEWLTNELHSEPEARLIVGQSGNGKTAIALKLRRMFPPTNDPAADSAEFPVVRILMPGRTSRRMFATEILTSLGQTRKPTTATEDLVASAYANLRALKVRTVLLDEIQHLNTGSANERVEMRNEIKNLADKCGVVVIGLGTETAHNVINSEQQLLKRFEVITLPLWRDDDSTRSLIYGIEQSLQLSKVSNIVGNDLFVRRILADAEGTIGAMRKMLQRAAIYAMVSGQEKITLDTLDKIDWIPPSKRLASSKIAMGVPTTAYGRQAGVVADTA